MNIVQVYKRFPSQESCIKHMEKVRWNGEPECPYCKSKRQSEMKKELRYHCNACNTTYSVTVGTIFQKTKIDIQRWFVAISLVLNAKKGISARQMARDLDVNKNTAWFMLMRIRKAMVEYGDLLEGIIEADETYIGGKDKNKHADKKPNGGAKRGRNTDTKTPVFGLLERGGRVKAGKVSDVTKRTLQTAIRSIVKEGSQIMTDEWGSYNGLSEKFKHSVVSHGAGEYVKGNAHTNTIEGFWALLKRGIVGQYHQVSKKHLNKYINEFCFRYNYRDDSSVFDILLLKAVS